MTLKERRKALGWDRAELARRADINRALLAMFERGDSIEAEDERARVEEVLDRAEAGEADVQLRAPRKMPPEA